MLSIRLQWGAVVAFGTVFIFASSLRAQILPEEAFESDSPMSQINFASDLRDISPTDWAYQALRDIITRYDCLAGYPDNTYRGNSSLTRYEFATAVNACWQRMERLIARAGIESIRSEDWKAIAQLRQQFNLEIALFRGRTDGLEARTQELEAILFSTTAKLTGEVIFAGSEVFGANNITNILRDRVDADTDATVQYRSRFNFDASFYGRDRLRTQLSASNAIPLFASGGDTGGTDAASLLYSNDGRLALDTSTVSENTNSVFLDLLSYRFPLGQNTMAHIFATGGSHFNYAETLNPYLDDRNGGKGAISRFGQRNPIYAIGGDGAGMGINHRFGNNFRVDLGYLANNANDSNAGLFEGNYSLLGQVVLGSPDSLQLGLTYVHNYNSANSFRFGGSGTATGSFSANLIPVALNANTERSDGVFDTPTVTNSYGLSLFYPFSDRMTISAWGGLTKATFIEFGEGDIWNYAIALAFPDLGKKGNLGALIFGAEPTLKGVRSQGNPVSLFDRDEVWHLEAFYRYQVSDRVALTPSIIWLPALNQNSSNDDAFIFSLQTHFEL
ncbi:MAG: iron uptake porin [Cyanobacteria bacterium SBLK]|nr:iron uptake porin [Cyanobacteria bacterium SBLK]